jgi:hypothetical protein
LMLSGRVVGMTFTPQDRHNFLARGYHVYGDV